MRELRQVNTLKARLRNEINDNLRVALLAAAKLFRNGPCRCQCSRILPGSWFAPTSPSRRYRRIWEYRNTITAGLRKFLNDRAGV